MKLTPTQMAAITCIGRHRRSRVTVGNGKQVSVRTLNALVKMGLVMWNGNSVMLTYMGERAFTKLHPHSKYKIN